MTRPWYRDPMINGCGGCLAVIALWLIISWITVELTP